MARQHGNHSISAIRQATFDSSALDFVNPLDVGIPDFAHSICSNEYGHYCVPNDFRGREVPELLKNGDVYEPKTLALMRRIAGDGDIVSGGGFIGDFFPALSEALHPRAALHSFEPNPVSYAAARRTIALNSLRNVVLSACAVGECEDILPLQVSRGNDNAMAARAKIVQDSDSAGVIEVPVTTLDALIPENRNVTVLHLDIEGHELAALTGAKKMISRCRPTIILEAAKPRMRRLYGRVLRQHFPELDYRMAGLIERNTVFLPNV